MHADLIEKNPGVNITFQIWWAKFWRGLAWLLPAIAVIAVLDFLVILGLMYVTGKQTALILAPYIGTIAMLPVTFLVYHKTFSKVLGMEFSGYQLILLKPEIVEEIKDGAL